MTLNVFIGTTARILEDRRYKMHVIKGLTVALRLLERA